MILGWVFFCQLKVCKLVSVWVSYVPAPLWGTSAQHYEAGSGVHVGEKKQHQWLLVNPGSKSYTSICAVVMFPLLLHELATRKLKRPCLLPLPSHHHLLHQLTTSQGSHTDPGQAQAALCSHHPFFSLPRCREEALFLEATVVEFLRRDAEKWYRCTWMLCWICPCLHISRGEGNAGQWHGSLSHFLPM